MPEILYTTLRIVHVVCGTIALITGIVSLVRAAGAPTTNSAERMRRHRASGRLFFYAMTGVFITAIILAATGGMAFLLSMGIFSYYLCWHGIRALQVFRGASWRWFDVVGAILLFATGSWLLWLAMAANAGVQGRIIFSVFGGVMILMTFQNLRRMRTTAPRDQRWFRMHQNSMGGALIATITAFCVTALYFMPVVVQWLGPTAVLSPLLAYVTRRHRAQMNTPRA